MTNVYDLIQDLYDGDDGWSQYLRREYAEEFIRREAFRGAGEEELLDIWAQVVSLVIYCGNTGVYIGDMSSEDFIGCVGWCGRNIADFVVDAESAEQFLTVSDRLLHYLRRRNAVFKTDGPRKALEKLVGEDGTMNLLNGDGTFKDNYERFRFNIVPDLPVKVFVNIGTKLEQLTQLMHQYFSAPRYRYDLDRASMLFFGFVPEGKLPDPEDDEAFHAFWEYFIFDYRLIKDSRKPLEKFYIYYKRYHKPDTRENKGNLSLLEALLKARLVMFTVNRFDGKTGWHSCRDFFTGDAYKLSLPIDDNYDTRGLLFSGHVMEDGNLVTNYVRGLPMTRTASLRLKELFKGVKEWYCVQCPAARDWEVFAANNGALVLHMAAYFSGSMLVTSFHKKTSIRDYKPAPLPKKNPVLAMVKALTVSLHFPNRDKNLLFNLWADFMATGKAPAPEDTDVTWGIALFATYVKLNHTYSFSVEDYATVAQLDSTEIYEKAARIEEALALEEFDPRYINEEGLLTMILS